MMSCSANIQVASARPFFKRCGPALEAKKT
jgi:hypothetical protein